MPNSKATRTPEQLAFDQALGARLRSLRVASGLNQTAVAKRAGVSFQQLQKYERGEDRVAVSRLVDIASALGLRVSDLLDDSASAPTLDQRVGPEVAGLIADYQACGRSGRAVIRQVAATFAAAESDKRD